MASQKFESISQNLLIFFIKEYASYYSHLRLQVLFNFYSLLFYSFLHCLNAAFFGLYQSWLQNICYN